MPIVQTQFPASLNLSLVTLEAGFTLVTGFTTDDYGHLSVSSVGDINADGIDDFIMGTDVDRCYVVFGAHSIGRFGSLSLSNLNGKNGFKIIGIPTARNWGYSVSSAGDVNADGIDDLIIGVSFVNNQTGTSYVVFGAHDIGSSGVLLLTNLSGSNGFNIMGVLPNDLSGSSVSGAGDVNADGIDDLIIGAQDANNGAGASYIVFGAHDLGCTGTLSLSSLNGTNGFNITNIGNDGEFYDSVSSVGDVNADGVDDLIFVTTETIDAIIDGIYLVFGTHNISNSGTFSLAHLNRTHWVNITGNYNFPVANSAGDVNDDGIDDFIVSVSGNNMTDRGGDYVVFGARDIACSGTLSLIDLNGTNGFNILDRWFEDGIEISIDTGDINGDDIADLIIHTTRACPQLKTI